MKHDKSHATLNGVSPRLDDSTVTLKNDWRTAQAIADRMWRRWLNEYLPILVKRTKWFDESEPLKVGDVALVVDPANPRNTWPKGKIISVVKAEDGRVRRVVIETPHGTCKRPTLKVAVLPVESMIRHPMTGGGGRILATLQLYRFRSVQADRTDLQTQSVAGMKPLQTHQVAPA